MNYVCKSLELLFISYLFTSMVLFAKHFELFLRLADKSIRYFVYGVAT